MITTEEEWNRAFERTMPLVSAGIGALSLIITIMAFRSQLAQRVFYQDGQYLVSVRYPGQHHNLLDFIQPANPDVIAVYSRFGPDPWSLYDWVCRNIDYRRDIGEMWQFPSETLARGQGDCEDSSILLCSLNGRGYVILGTYQDYGHAWYELGGQLFETTYTQARHVPDLYNYYPYLYFNDHDVIELWPGALEEVFALPRKETTKLTLMARALGAMA